MVLGEFFYILLFTKGEPARFNQAIKKERKFLKRMIDFRQESEKGSNSQMGITSIPDLNY